jgi:hypothetical protein
MPRSARALHGRIFRIVRRPRSAVFAKVRHVSSRGLQLYLALCCSSRQMAVACRKHVRNQKLRNAPISFRMSVCLPAFKNSRTGEGIFQELLHGGGGRVTKICRDVQFWLKLDISDGHFTWTLNTRFSRGSDFVGNPQITLHAVAALIIVDVLHMVGN